MAVLEPLSADTKPAVDDESGVARDLSPTSLIRRLLRLWSFRVGASVVLLIVLAGLFAPLIAPYDPYANDLQNRLTDPAWYAGGSMANFFGTDGLGRDYLSRLLYGARTSLFIGVCAVLLSGLIGCTLGILGGYLGGRTDMVVTFIITCRLAMPGALLVLAVVAIVGPSIPNLILIIGLLYWPPFAVVSRTATLEVRQMDFIDAAIAVGGRRPTIVFREVIPNIANSILVIATIELGYIILAEAALSFLGLGVQQPIAAWGLMINEGKQFMYAKPWLIMIPGLALLVLVFAINLVGDALRDAIDPNRSEQ